MAEAVLTPQEVAAYFRCDERTVRRMLNTGTLQGFRIGRQWRIERQEMHRFMGRPDARAVLGRQARLAGEE